MTLRVLYTGDTQVNLMTSMKGIDSWSFSYYTDSARFLRDALNNNPEMDCDHIPSSETIAKFPSMQEDLEEYDCLIVSDVGYNNLSFQPGNIPPFRIPMGPDRVSAISDYVLGGGGFLMVGGWLSFSGIQGKGLYGGTAIEEILPVTCEPRGVDDRIEVTEGFSIDISEPSHPIVVDLPWEEDYLLLGYNKVHLKEGSDLVASFRGDPIIATRRVGKGRTSVFTSDVGPHWGGSLLEWPGYAEFWQRMVQWTAGTLG